MKKINLLMMALGSALVLSLASCDKCKDVTCENGGTCEDGTCTCADMYYGDMCETHCMNGTYADGSCTCEAGYEGEACDVESRAVMIGSYAVADACSESGAADYNCSISNSSTAADGVLISNFWESFVNNVKGTVSGSTLTIDSQEPDSDGWKVSGTGTYEDGKITFTYSITDPDGNVDNCSSNWNKQ